MIGPRELPVICGSAADQRQQALQVQRPFKTAEKPIKVEGQAVRKQKKRQCI